MKDNFNKILKDKKSLFMIGYSVFLIVIFIVGYMATPGAIETVNKMLYAPANSSFNDQALYNCVIDAYNKEHAGIHMTESSVLTDEQLQDIKTLECPGEGISDVEGLQKLKNLEYLDLSNNNITKLTYKYNSEGTDYDLDVLGPNSKIKTVILDNNQISKFGDVGVSKSKDLEHLSVRNNQMEGSVLLVSHKETPKLKYVDLSNNHIRELHVIPNASSSPLEELHVDNNNLQRLDLSDYSHLTNDKTTISGNPFESFIYVYSRGSRNFYLKNPVQLPSTLQSDSRWNITWSLPVNDVVSIDNENKITALNTGDVTVNGTGAAYSVKCNIHSIELTVNNPKYKISDDKYLWVGSDITKTKEEILSNIDQGPVKADNIKYVLQSNTDSDLINQEVSLVVSNSTTSAILAEIPVYGAASSSNIRDVDSDYVYENGDYQNWLRLSPGLTVFGSDYSMSLREPGGSAVKGYKNVRITNSKYDLSLDKDYLWIGSDTIDQNSVSSSVSVQNGRMVYDSNDKTLTLKADNGEKIKTWDVIGWSSSKYDLDGQFVTGIPMTDGSTITNYVNLRGEDIDPFSSSIVDELNANINFTSEDVNIERVTDRTGRIQYFNVKRNGNVILRFDIISFDSSKYSEYMNKDYIDVKSGELDKTAFTGTDFSSFYLDDSGNRYMYEKDNVLYVMKYISENTTAVYKKWDLVKYSSNKYDLSNDYIAIGEGDTFDTINNSITKTNASLVPVTGNNGLEQIQIRHKTADGPLIRSLSIVSYSSSYYDLSSKYIFTGSESNEFIRSKFNLTGSHLDFEGNKLVLKADDAAASTIKTWTLVRCSSDHYYINKNFVFYKDSSRNYQDGDITITTDNAEILGIENNKLKIKQNNNVVIELPKVYVSSETYNLNDEYVYLGPNKSSIDDLKIHYVNQNGDQVISENNPYGIKIMYAASNDMMIVVSESGKVYIPHDSMKIVKLISLVSNKYKINDHAIFILNDDYNANDIWLNYTDAGSSNYRLSDVGGRELSLLHTVHTGTGSSAMEFNVTDHVWSIVTLKSNKYEINGNYIDTKGSEFSIDQLTSNHPIDNDAYDADNNMLTITGATRYGQTTKNFKVVTYTSNTYDLSKDYINVGTGDFDASLINVPGCDKEVIGGPGQSEYRFVIKYQGEEIRSWDIVGYRFSTNTYNEQLNQGYLFFDNHEITDQLSTYNCDAYVVNDILRFKLKNSNKYLEEEYPLLKYTSTKYDLSKNYINFPDGNVDDLYDNVTFNNNDFRIQRYDDSGYIYLYYKDRQVKRWYYTSYSSDEYDLDKDYIFEPKYTPQTNQQASAIVINKISSNWDLQVSYNNYLELYDRGTIIKRWKMIGLISADYSINSDYINIGTDDSINTNKISFTSSAFIYNLDMRVNSNGDLEVYEMNTGRIIKTLKTIKYSSSTYDLSKPYIAANGNINTMFDTNADGVVVDKQNKKVKLIYNDHAIKSWDLLMIESDKYYISDNYIFVGDHGFSEDDLSLTNMEVESIIDANHNGILGDKYDIVVFRNTTSGYSYETTRTISDGYIKLNDLDVVDNVIKNIKEGTTVNELSNQIQTSGTVVIKDSDGHEVTDNRALRTGDVVYISLSDLEITYRVAVKGDVSGNGVIDLTDVIQLYQHEEEISIIPDTEQYRLMAGDVNNDGVGDGVIDLSDVIRLFQYTNGNEFPNNSTYFLAFIVKNISKIGGIA